MPVSAMAEASAAALMPERMITSLSVSVCVVLEENRKLTAYSIASRPMPIKARRMPKKILECERLVAGAGSALTGGTNASGGIWLHGTPSVHRMKMSR